jgi:hypothetical protein
VLERLAPLIASVSSSDRAPRILSKKDQLVLYLNKLLSETLLIKIGFLSSLSGHSLQKWPLVFYVYLL